MTMLVVHDGVSFQDQVVYLTGHDYRRCVFTRCTLVLSGWSGSALDRCEFDTCTWHLNLVVHDAEAWDAFQSTFAGLITKTLPSAEPG